MTQTYDTPQEAEDAFYDALDEGDLNRMLSVWAEADDICCLLPMHPMIQGREAVTGVFTHLVALRPEAIYQDTQNHQRNSEREHGRK